jgi:replicative DNA helicase
MSTSERVAPLDLAPHSIEAEEAVLGSLLQLHTGERAFHDVTAMLKPGDFFNVRHSWIYEAAIRVAARVQYVDVRTLAEELLRANRLSDIGGEAFLNYLPTTTPSAMHARAYANIVAEHADRRALLGAAGQIAMLAHDLKRDIEAVKGESADAVMTASGRRTAIHFKEAFDTTESIRSELENGVQMGIRFGFRDLDKHFRKGLVRGQYVIVAGRPAMGKSAFALAVAAHAASGKTTPDNQPARVLYLTYEMTDEDNQIRLISQKMGIEINAVYGLTPDDPRWKQFERACAEVGELSIVYEEESDNVEALEGVIRDFIDLYGGIDLIIIDRLELVLVGNMPAGTDNALLTSVSSRVLRIAKRYAPTIAVAQLNRDVEKRADKRPLLSDLRMSGSLEQDATIVLMMYRPAYYDDSADKNDAEVILRKNRQGSTGTIKLFFRSELTAFHDIAWGQDEQTER